MKSQEIKCTFLIWKIICLNRIIKNFKLKYDKLSGFLWSQRGEKSTWMEERNVLKSLAMILWLIVNLKYGWLRWIRTQLLMIVHQCSRLWFLGCWMTHLNLRWIRYSTTKCVRMHNYYLFQITKMTKTCGKCWATLDRELTKRQWVRNWIF